MSDNGEFLILKCYTVKEHVYALDESYTKAIKRVEQW